MQDQLKNNMVLHGSKEKINQVAKVKSFLALLTDWIIRTTTVVVFLMIQSVSKEELHFGNLMKNFVLVAKMFKN